MGLWDDLQSNSSGSWVDACASAQAKADEQCRAIHEARAAREKRVGALLDVMFAANADALARRAAYIASVEAEASARLDAALQAAQYDFQRKEARAECDNAIADAHGSVHREISITQSIVEALRASGLDGAVAVAEWREKKCRYYDADLTDSARWRVAIEVCDVLDKR